MKFIADEDFRRAILVDIGAIERALAGGEWKSATVVAGSVIEALLLQGLLKLNATDFAAGRTATKSAGGGKKAPTDPHKWVLAQYIAGSEAAGLIEPDTAASCGLAKNYRNFIHPGRATRLGTPCDRGTAYAAVGAMEHVIRDLSAP